MSKQSRFQWEYRKTASKAHKEVGEILRTSPNFCSYTSYQEYPVNRVAPFYSSGREHFDWVIPGLKLVIEVHGEQHYRKVNFGGVSDREAIDNLHATQRRDQMKMEAAITAGWTYIIIPYNVRPSEEYILEQYRLNYNSAPLVKKKQKKESIWKKNYSKIKDKLNEQKRNQYRKLKEARKNHGLV